MSIVRPKLWFFLSLIVLTCSVYFLRIMPRSSVVAPFRTDIKPVKQGNVWVATPEDPWGEWRNYEYANWDHLVGIGVGSFFWNCFWSQSHKINFLGFFGGLGFGGMDRVAALNRCIAGPRRSCICPQLSTATALSHFSSSIAFRLLPECDVGCTLMSPAPRLPYGCTTAVRGHRPGPSPSHWAGRGFLARPVEKMDHPSLATTPHWPAPRKEPVIPTLIDCRTAVSRLHPQRRRPRAVGMQVRGEGNRADDGGELGRRRGVQTGKDQGHFSTSARSSSTLIPRSPPPRGAPPR